MKKILSFILGALFIMSAFSFPVCAENEYPEGADDWAKAGIIKSMAIIDSISPEGLRNDYKAPVTREDFCTVLFDLCKKIDRNKLINITDTESPFEDTTSFYAAVCYQLGITEGTTETTFEPDRNITREEMTVMIKRFADVMEITLPDGDLSVFDDSAKISEWARGSVASVSAAGIMNGISETEFSPLTYVSWEEFLVVIPRVYKFFTGKEIQIYEESDPDVLVKLNIVSQEDFEKDGSITNREALQTISKLIGIEPDKTDLKYWYMIDALEPLDSLADEDKLLLMGLRSEYLDTEDFFYIDLDKNTTNLQALAYATSLVRQRDGCVVYPPASAHENSAEIFDAALKNGFIKEIPEADAKILRKDFYEFLRKALYIKFSNFGITTSYARYIDRHINKKDKVVEAVKEEKTITEISADVTINDDLSITYKLPEEYENIINSEFMVMYRIVTDGVEKGGTGNFFREPELEGYRFVEMLSGEENPDFLRVTFTKTDFETRTSEVYYFDVDLSDFERIYTDEVITPGTYYHKPETWPATKLTLAPGERFQQGSYYVLIGYETTYRKAEYNSVFQSAFRATSTSNAHIPSGKRSFGVSADDIHIQKITVERQKDKFILYVSPISEGEFKNQTM